MSCCVTAGHATHQTASLGAFTMQTTTTLPVLSMIVCVQVASGSRVSGSLIAALEVLHQGDMAAVGASVASMAWQQLQALPTSLLWDLAWLVQDGYQQQDVQQVQLFGGLLRHYVQVGRQEELQALDFPVLLRAAQLARLTAHWCLSACGTQTQAMASVSAAASAGLGTIL